MWFKSSNFTSDFKLLYNSLDTWKTTTIEQVSQQNRGLSTTGGVRAEEAATGRNTMQWTECVPPKFLCWNPNPNLMLSGDGAFGKQLVIRKRSLQIKAVHYNNRPEKQGALYPQVRTHVNQEKGYHQEQKHAGTLISDFQPLEPRNKHLRLIFKPPTDSNLLQYPKLTKTHSMGNTSTG